MFEVYSKCKYLYFQLDTEECGWRMCRGGGFLTPWKQQVTVYEQLRLIAIETNLAILILRRNDWQKIIINLIHEKFCNI